MSPSPILDHEAELACVDSDQRWIATCLKRLNRAVFFVSTARPVILRNSPLSQWPSGAKFVAIRIGQVKEPLAPFGIARCRVWSIAARDHARIGVSTSEW
jgi:hypothetical protein